MKLIIIIIINVSSTPDSRSITVYKGPENKFYSNFQFVFLFYKQIYIYIYKEVFISQYSAPVFH